MKFSLAVHLTLSKGVSKSAGNLTISLPTDETLFWILMLNVYVTPVAYTSELSIAILVEIEAEGSTICNSETRSSKRALINKNIFKCQ